MLRVATPMLMLHENNLTRGIYFKVMAARLFPRTTISPTKLWTVKIYKSLTESDTAIVKFQTWGKHVSECVLILSISSTDSKRQQSASIDACG